MKKLIVLVMVIVLCSVFVVLSGCVEKMSVEEIVESESSQESDVVENESSQENDIIENEPLAESRVVIQKEPWQEQYNMGIKYFEEKKFDEGKAAFRKAIELDPKQDKPYIALIKFYETQEDTNMLRKTLKEAIKQAGKTPEIAKVLGELPTVERKNFGDSYTITEYDENGDYLRWTSYTTDGTVSIIREYENGVELKHTVYYPDGKIKLVYENNKDGECVRFTEYNPDGTMEGYFTYEDDEKNHTYRETRHNPDGTIRYYYIFEYENGLMKYSKLYNSDGSLDFVSEYDKGDADGRQKELRRTYYNPDGTIKMVVDGDNIAH